MKETRINIKKGKLIDMRRIVFNLRSKLDDIYISRYYEDMISDCDRSFYYNILKYLCIFLYKIEHL